MFDFVLKGANTSQLEKDIGSDLFPANEHFFGLVTVRYYCSHVCNDAAAIISSATTLWILTIRRVTLGRATFWRVKLVWTTYEVWLHDIIKHNALPCECRYQLENLFKTGFGLEHVESWRNKVNNSKMPSLSFVKSAIFLNFNRVNWSKTQVWASWNLFLVNTG